MARFHSTKTLRTRADPQAILDLLSRPDRRPDWQPEILWMRGPERLTPGEEQHGRARMMGFEVAGRSRTIAVTDRVFEEEALVGVRLRIRYEISSDDGRVEVAHHLIAELPRGFWGRAVSLFLRSRLRVMQTRALKNLVAHVEPEASS
ncbi:MAG TPA: SRPBCC family protein [Actinomycetota bacterium]|nr:SRPBCC family protein [Actinomycetota bacterium]